MVFHRDPVSIRSACGTKGSPLAGNQGLLSLTRAHGPFSSGTMQPIHALTDSRLVIGPSCSETLLEEMEERLLASMGPMPHDIEP